MAVDAYTGVPQQEVVQLQMDTRGYEQGASRAQAATAALAAGLDQVLTRLDGLSKRSGNRLMALGAGIGAGLGASVVVAAKYEQQLSSLVATQAMVGKSSRQMADDIDSAAKRFPTSRSELIELTKSIQDLGVTAPAKIDATRESMIRLSAVSGESLPGLTNQVLALDRALGSTTSVSGIQKRAQTLAALRASQGGGTVSGIARMSEAIAPFTRTAGIGEAETLGLGAGLEKAGAPGIAGANALNNMIADITRLTQAGSPELAKYANLIGVTTDEFKKLDTTESIVRIFEEIGRQGPEAMKTLDRLGMDGVRTARAIQAVANQPGGLRGAVFTAQKAAEGGGKEFMSASDEALSGMNDEWVKIRQNIEGAVKAVGDELLPFFEAGTKALSSMVGVATTLVETFSKPIAAAGVGAGILSIVGGGALSGYKALATAGAAGWAMRSSPVTGTRAGFQAGRAVIKGGPEALPVNPWTAKAAAGELGGIQSAMYNTGMLASGFTGSIGRGTERIKGVGGRFGEKAGELWSDIQVRKRGAQGRSVAEALAPFGAQAAAEAVPAVPKRGFWSKAKGIGLGAPGLVVSEFNRGTETMYREGRTPAYDRKGMGGLKSNTDAIKGATTQMGKLRVGLSGALKSIASLIPQGVAAGLGEVGGIAKKGVKGAPGAIGAAASGIAGMMSPVGWGITGGAAAVGAGLYVKSKLDEGAAAAGSANETSKNPFAVYDEALNRTTRSLVDFESAVKAAADAARPDDADVSEGRTVTPEDVQLANMAGRELKQKAFKNASIEAATTFTAMTVPGMDTGTLGQLKLDLVDRYAQTGAQKALDTEMTSTEAARTAGSNYAKTWGQEEWTGKQSPQQEADLSLLVGGIKQRATDTTMKSGVAAAQQESLASVFAAAGQMGKVQGATFIKQVEESGGILPEGFDLEKFRELYAQPAEGGGANRTTFEEAFTKASGKGGLENLDQLGVVIGDTAAMTKNVATLAAEDTSSRDYQLRNLKDVSGTQPRGYSGVGAFSVDNEAVQRAVDNEGDTTAVFKGFKVLADQAMKTTSNLSEADLALADLQRVAGSASDPLYTLAEAARGAVQGLRDIARSRMSREQRAQDSITAGTALGNVAKKGPTYAPDAQRAEAEMRATEDEQYSFVQGLLQAEKDYGIQRTRMEQDFTTSVSRSNRDYARSRGRAQEDFQIQSLQSTEDYLQSRNRAQEDYDKQLARMVEDAAKTLYDPYKRAQSQMTLGADSLMVNLQRQQSLMRQQDAAVESLRAAGMNDRTIAELGLTDTQNRSQAVKLASDIANNPALVEQFNAQIAGRLDAAKGLVVDTSNPAFQRMQEDFQQTATRAEQDFDKGMTRSGQAFKRQMDRQADDYATTMADQQSDQAKAYGRAREDLARYGEQVYGDLATMATNAAAWVARNIPVVGDALKAELDRITQMTGERAAAIQQLYNRGMQNDAGTGVKVKGGTILKNAADGGMVRGPGGPTDDLIPARLSNGEFVVRAASVSKYGVDTMDAINRGEWKAYALGGLVAAGVAASTTAVHSAVPAGASYTYVTDNSVHIRELSVTHPDPKATLDAIREESRRRQLVRPRAGGKL